MESLLNRYRNITVLLLVIMAQLVLLAVDAKNGQGVPMIRVWAVTAVTPAARVLEGLRGGGSGFLHNYILLHDTNEENRRLRAELDRLKMENIALKNDLNTADRAKALQVFQEHTASKTVGATVIATGAGANSRVVFVDRGSVAGVVRGMGVVTPDGIVGKVVAAYPTASEVLLITDPDFAAGVISKSGVRGTLKGQGTPQCRVEYVPLEDKVEVGEWFYTSGDDRVFPRGFPVGIVKSVTAAQPFKEILVEPSGMQRGLQDVLILIEGVHQAIPETPPGVQPMYIAPPVPASEAKPASDAPAAAPPGTEADKLRLQYKAAGEAQNHNYGDNPPGSKAIDFTRLGTPAAPAGNTGTNAPAATGAGSPAPAGRGTPSISPGDRKAAPAGTTPNPPADRRPIPTGTTPNPPGDRKSAPAGTTPGPAVRETGRPPAGERQPGVGPAGTTAPSGGVPATSGTVNPTAPSGGSASPKAPPSDRKTGPGGTGAPPAGGVVQPAPAPESRRPNPAGGGPGGRIR